MSHKCSRGWQAVRAWLAFVCLFVDLRANPFMVLACLRW